MAVDYGTNRPKTYIVPQSTNIYQIANQFYGSIDISIIRSIATANNIRNLKYLPAGMKLKLP